MSTAPEPARCKQAYDRGIDNLNETRRRVGIKREFMSDTAAKNSDIPDALSRRLGYTFDNQTLLRRALTHRSAGSDNNERLEFLGDSVLNFVIAAALYQRCPAASEGDLSRLRAALVREQTLAEIAQTLELGAALILGPGEMRNGSFRRDSILADAVEAVLGAIFSESGFDRTRRVILSWFEGRLDNLPTADEVKDPKTRLQEWLQARGRTLPEYTLVSRSGPEHAQQFVSACNLPDGDETCRGEGAGRRKAEQAAARQMLAQLTGAAQ